MPSLPVYLIRLGIEIRDYIPEDAITFSTRARRALDAPIGALVVTGKALTIVAVYAGPWLGVLVVVLVILTPFVRLARRLKCRGHQ